MTISCSWCTKTLTRPWVTLSHQINGVSLEDTFCDDDCLTRWLVASMLWTIMEGKPYTRIQQRYEKLLRWLEIKPWTVEEPVKEGR